MNRTNSIASRLRVVFGAAPALLLLGSVVAAGAVLRLTAFALTASLAGGAMFWARASRSVRGRRIS
jgi:uncharacterized protein (DUF1786 family)